MERGLGAQSRWRWSHDGVEQSYLDSWIKKRFEALGADSGREIGL
jgi:hypothetical protein